LELRILPASQLGHADWSMLGDDIACIPLKLEHVHACNLRCGRERTLCWLLLLCLKTMRSCSQLCSSSLEMLLSLCLRRE
jgi:hypothetical protein